VRVPVAAGRREVIVTFLAKAASLANGKREPFGRPFPRGLNIPEGRYGSYLRRVDISGPYEATGPGHTASRERIFVCRPAAEQAGVSADAESCAAEILGRVVRRAYRRPVGPADVAPFVAFYREAHAEQGSFDDGIQVALKAVLVSPEFLFRVARDPPGATPGSVYGIDDVELASRLSFFLWSSIPDDELLSAAERGALGEPAELERQVRRMSADPAPMRSSAISRASGFTCATSTP
jgi:hypothetical protein